MQNILQVINQAKRNLIFNLKLYKYKRVLNTHNLIYLNFIFFQNKQLLEGRKIRCQKRKTTSAQVLNYFK